MSRWKDIIKQICKQVIAVIFLLFSASVTLMSQNKPATTSNKALDAYNAGLELYILHNYADAEKSLLKAIDADREFIDAYLVMAQMYEDWDQPLKAIETYHTGLEINPGYFSNGYILLANLEYGEGLYEDAKSSYEHYLALNTGSTSKIAKARDGIERCNFAIEAMENPVDFKPVNLGSQINSRLDEYWPSLSTDEQTLVITRLIPIEDFMSYYQEDFYISHRLDTTWGKIKDVGRPLNTADNEGAQTLSGDGKYMIFTACNRKDGEGRCDLYYTEKKGDQWSVPRNLGKPVNTKYRETQPSITPDGRTLYFSSDRPGGKGEHDLWVSYLQENNEWSAPVNLGENINTQGIEMSPFIHPDNQSLYFSSDRHMGMGGYDLFISRKDSMGNWSKPENLGYPINTNRDEIGLIVNSKGDKAYYSSDMIKENGKDIFMFDLPVKDQPVMVTYLKGKVFDADDHTLLKARCELIDLVTGVTFYQTYSDSINGEFIVSIPVNSNYMLNVSRDGYLFFSENFSLKNTYRPEKPYQKDIPLKPIKIGSTIVLKNVFYETDSFALKPESTIELDKVIKLLENNPGIRIEISGHTDNTGSAAYNQKLSENRAKTVAEYLLSSSVSSNRIVYKGYGMDAPVSGNDTSEGRAQNRRTELKIID